jgi:hypothetical protein
MNPQFESPSSLLAYFPNLERWATQKANRPAGDLKHHMRDEVAKHCPSLKRLLIGADAPTIVDMLTEVFNNLISICMRDQDLSAETIAAILRHRDTLNTVATVTVVDGLFDSEAIPEVKKFDISGWTVLSIPQHCTRLRRMRILFLEMEMDDIEKTEWRCYDLEQLYIRIRGLDTKEKIDRAIQLWKEGRIAIREKQFMDVQMESSSTNPQLESIILTGDTSIEARVAKHLLQFKKLREVWLGWKVRKVRKQDRLVNIRSLRVGSERGGKSQSFANLPHSFLALNGSCDQGSQ